MTKRSDVFHKAFQRTMVHEGGYSFDSLDPGGETYMGISRVYWPGWPGWEIIDNALAAGLKLSNKPELPPIVRRFYRENFWNRFRGNDVAKASSKVAAEIFDTAVNMGVHRAVSYLQESLNLLNVNGRKYPDMVVDGQIGPTSLRYLGIFMDQEPGKDKKELLILNVMNTLQGSYYIKKMRESPEKERFRGWFTRI